MIRSTALALLLLALGGLLLGCGDDDGAGADATAPGPDGSGNQNDAAVPGPDGGPGPDASAADGGTPDGGPGPSGRWVSGYYVGYQRDWYPADVVDFTALTHLVVGRITPVADGTVNTTFDIDAVAGPAMASDLSSRAHAAGVRAILMVGGAGEYGNWVAAAAAGTRPTFVANLVATMEDLGYDGLDLDWEPIYADDQPVLLDLIADLRAAAPGIELTVPVGWVNANFPTVEPFYADLAAAVDQVNLMTYGMADAWDGWSSWHSSALDGEGGTTPSSVSSSVDAYLAAGVPAARLGIGIGFYGSCWGSPVTGPGQATGGSGVIASDNTMSFTHIMDAYFDPDAYEYDAAADAPYLSFAQPTGPEGCTFMSYEDEASILAKGQYVRDLGLGGTIVWTINQGYLPDAAPGERDPLMAALRQAFLD